MCRDGIEISIEDAEGSVVVVDVETEAGSVKIIGECSISDGRLRIRGAHIQGLHPGALGRRKLNEIVQKMMEDVDVDTIEIDGGIRTTGANPGRAPKRIVARRRPRS